MRAGELTDLEFYVLEYLILTHDEGYGWKIVDWLASQRDLATRVTSVYRALHRLEGRGLLEHRIGSGKERVAGSLRTYFRTNETGRLTYRMERDRRTQCYKRWMKSLEGNADHDQTSAG